jgi:hypothetical protein
MTRSTASTAIGLIVSAFWPTTCWCTHTYVCSYSIIQEVHDYVSAYVSSDLYCVMLT